MDKEEIIRRLKKISEYAVHVTGEPPFIMGLDDGIALNEAVTLLKEQEPKPVGKEWNECPNCGKVLSSIEHIHFCGMCGQVVKWNE